MGIKLDEMKDKVMNNDKISMLKGGVEEYKKAKKRADEIVGLKDKVRKGNKLEGGEEAPKEPPLEDFDALMKKAGILNDSSWVRNALFIPRDPNASPTAVLKDTKVSARTNTKRSRQFSDSELNFSDTAFGGNRAINPRPQFTRYADRNARQILLDAQSPGAGRYYLEAIDEPAQRIYMQFGVVVHNSLTGFLNQMYDRDLAQLANRGVVSKIAFRFGQALALVVFSPITIVGLNVLFNGITLFNRAIHIANRAPMSRFYYIRPTMPLYWESVQTLMNMFTAQLGMGSDYAGVGDISMKSKVDSKDLDKIEYERQNGRLQPSAEYLKEIADIEKAGGMNAQEAQAKSWPGNFIMTDGQLDIRAISNRYQRLADAHHRALQEIIGSDKNTTDAQVRTKLVEYFKNREIPDELYQNSEELLVELRKKRAGNNDSKAGMMTRDNYLDSYIRQEMVNGNVQLGRDYVSESENTLTQEALSNLRNEGVDDTEIRKALGEDASAIELTAELGKEQDETNQMAIAAYNVNTRSNWDKFWSTMYNEADKYKAFAEAELRDGSAFVGINVNYQDSESESFSNSTSSSSLIDSLNEKSGGMRKKIFDFAGGNISSNSLVQGIVNIGKGAMDVAAGMLDMVGLRGLGALGGAAFIDVPDFWDNSSANLTSNDYSISLVSWNSDPYSLLQNIYFPLACIMAGALPHKTGKSSYGPPFYCKLWSQGRSQIESGMITSLSIQRGGGNAGWNNRFQPIRIDVSFSVTNLSKIMSVPITNNVSAMDALGLSLFDEVDTLQEYMNALTGISIQDQFYLIPRWKLRHRQAQAQFSSWFSMNNLIQSAVGTTPGRMLSAVYRQAEL